MSVSEVTFVHVDDSNDDIFLTSRAISKSNFPSRLVSQPKPERILSTLGELTEGDIGLDEIIVLLDINMPRCDGYTALRNIRMNDEFRSAVVLMLSNSDKHDDMMSAYEAGCDGYLVKPFEIDEFMSVLSRVPFRATRLRHFDFGASPYPAGDNFQLSRVTKLRH